MLDEEPVSENLGEVEAVLASLSPRQSLLSRDRLMFLAGQASVPQATARTGLRRLVWPTLTLMATLLAGLFGWRLSMRPEPEIVREIVYVQQPTPEATNPPSPAPQPARNSLDRERPPDEFPTFVGEEPFLEVSLPWSYRQRQLMAQLVEFDSVPAYPAYPAYSADDGDVDEKPMTQRQLLQSLLEEQLLGYRPAPDETPAFNWRDLFRPRPGDQL